VQYVFYLEMEILDKILETEIPGVLPDQNSYIL
jgi:hypothetical protein